MDYRRLLALWLTNGASRNDALSGLLKENARRGRPVADQAVVGLVAESSPPGSENTAPRTCEDVTQDTQKLRKPRNSTKLNGFHRCGVPPPPPPDEDRDAFRRELAAGVPSTLPLAGYLRVAVLESADTTINVPWQRPFELVRLLKAHPDMAGKTAKQAFRAADQAMARLVKRHPPGGRVGSGWSGLGLFASREDAEATVLDTWDKIRYLPGRTPLDNALEMARREPLGIGEEDRERRSEGYEDFVSLAGWLQVGMGDRPILLPCREVGELLGVEPMTVSRYRRCAMEDGYLTEVKGARYGGGRGKGQATEFRFDVSRWDCLQDRAR